VQFSGKSNMKDGATDPELPPPNKPLKIFMPRQSLLELELLLATLLVKLKCVGATNAEQSAVRSSNAVITA
jgi:hypothetical protein